MKNNIAAGIVLYNPNIKKLRENIHAIIEQVDKVVLVDNCSQNIDIIRAMYASTQKIILIENRKNNGIAKALNQICSWCKENNYSWVITLDQDSLVQEDIIKKYKKYISTPNIAIMTPVIIDRNNIKCESQKNDFEYVDKCITSASFTNIDIWYQLQGFDEYMFIDLVDFEYCHRIIRNGFKILKVNDATILHQLGNLEVKKIFGRNIHVTNHNPLRCYYYARNNIYFYKKYNDIPILKIIENIIKKIFKIIVYEEQKMEKCNSIVIGIVEGLGKKIR